MGDARAIDIVHFLMIAVMITIWFVTNITLFASDIGNS